MQRETQTFNGIRFNRYPDSERESDRRYFKGWVIIDGRRTKISIHRYTWFKNNGVIPKGYHIHHIEVVNMDRGWYGTYTLYGREID